MSEPTTAERHERLQALLQDRKAKKGRASRVLYLCLDAELAATLAEANGELNIIRSKIEEATKEQAHDKRQGGVVPIDPELQPQLDAAEAKVAAASEAADNATIGVLLVALPSAEYDQLMKKHPAPDDDAASKDFGADVEPFLDALVLACATKVQDRDGALIDIDPDELYATLSSGERDIARRYALEINQRVASVPFSVAKSSSARASDGRSKRRSPSA